MQFPITIGLHRSHFLLFAHLLTTMLTICTVMAMPWHGGLRMACCLFVLIIASIAWRQLALVPSAIRLEASGNIQVALAGDSEFVEAKLEHAPTVHPWLTVVRLKTVDGQVVPLIVAVDTMEKQDFRRLRVFLRWRAEVSVDEDDAP